MHTPQPRQNTKNGATQHKRSPLKTNKTPAEQPPRHSRSRWLRPARAAPPPRPAGPVDSCVERHPSRVSSARAAGLPKEHVENVLRRHLRAAVVVGCSAERPASSASAHPLARDEFINRQGCQVKHLFRDGTPPIVLMVPYSDFGFSAHEFKERKKIRAFNTSIAFIVHALHAS